METTAQTICRTCMKSDESVVFLFDKTNNNMKTLAEMLTECTKHNASKEDKLPKYICEKCSSDIQNSYYFKERAEQSYKLLKQIYGNKFENANFRSNTQYLEKYTQTDIEDIKLFNIDKQQRKQKELNETSCPICLRILSRKDHIKEHIIKIHKDDPKKYFPTISGCKLKKMECPICERKFNRKHHVTRHIVLVHKEDPNSELMRVNQSAKTTAEPEIAKNCSTKDKKCNFLERNPISSDPETEKDLIHSNVKALAKGEPNYELGNLKEDEPEEMVVKVELPHSYAFENEDSDHEDNYIEEKTNFQTADDVSSYSSDKGSEALIEMKKLMRQKRYGSGDGTPEERTCQLCQRIFSRLCHLRRHVQSAHTQEKPHKCSHCEKRFSRSDLLKNHIQGVHSEKTHKCDVCEKSFSRKEALQRHKKIPHGIASGISFNCEICERKFSQKRFLVRHQLLHTDRIFACRFCEETFKDRKLFYDHERSHKCHKKDFLCSICGESFGRIDYLRIHVQRHVGDKPHKCQYCEKSFIRKSDLKEHERYHTNTRPNICKICGKAFVRRSKLTIHMRIHTGEKPYKCEHCSKSFAQSNDLKAHVRRHTGERYSCEQCDASFLQLYGLRQHALNVHGTLIESSTGRLEKIEISS